MGLLRRVTERALESKGYSLPDEPTAAAPGSKKGRQRLQEAGVNAQAVLVSFQEVGQQNFTPLVNMTLRVSPPDGGAAFEVVVRTQVEFSMIGNLKPGDSFTARYDPEDHSNFEVGEKVSSANGGGQSIDNSSAGDIAAAVQATGETGQRQSLAQLLATGQRMTAVLGEFSPSGNTVGDLDPSQPDPDDPVYVIKTELQINGSSPIEALFMSRVPEAKVATLSLGARLNVAVNPANPSREVAIDWASSPVTG
jgi:hypothetical protein